jgi:CheY-like chemotaxis protein
MARPLEGKRVLVVEDNYLIGEALCEVIRDAGAVTIGPVGSPDAAIEAVRQHVLDGVLLDVKLQGVNGSTVAEYLRGKNVPFVLVTGYPKQGLPPQLQAFPQLAKPVLPSDLVEAATAAFGGRRSAASR